MSIEVVCPSCETSHKVKDELAGKKLKCKGCQKVIPIPSAATATEADPWENLDENEGGDELPAVVRQAPARKSRTAGAPRERNVQPAIERTVAARKFGIGMMVFGAIGIVAPLLGLQFKALREHGYLTPVVGVGIVILGVVLFMTSHSRILTNVMTMGSKAVLWGIIGLGLLILIGGAALIGGLYLYLGQHG